MDTKMCARCSQVFPVAEFQVIKKGAAKPKYDSWCKPCRAEYFKQYYRINKRRISDSKKHEYYERTDPTRAKGRRAAAVAFDRASKENKVPMWVEAAEFFQIYERCARMAPGFVVDHIIPLNGNDVTGLHVPDNLQILTRRDNGRKRNKHLLE